MGDEAGRPLSLANAAPRADRSWLDPPCSGTSRRTRLILPPRRCSLNIAPPRRSCLFRRCDANPNRARLPRRRPRRRRGMQTLSPSPTWDKPPDARLGQPRQVHDDHHRVAGEEDDGTPTIGGQIGHVWFRQYIEYMSWYTPTRPRPSIAETGCEARSHPHDIPARAASCCCAPKRPCRSPCACT